MTDSHLHTSPEINELATALAAAQLELTNPEKNCEVKIAIRAKSGGAASYEFKYASLDVVLKLVRPVLGKNGLSFTQIADEAEIGTVLTTRLMHKSGQWIEGSVKVGGLESMQGLGSALTYLKRYCLCAMLGICAEDDEDANVADGNRIKRRNDEDLWSGPLNKTQLHTAIGEFVREIEACDDTEQLTALLNTPENVALKTQCQADKPSWWFGQDGSDVMGLEERIKVRQRDFKEATGF